MQISIAYLSEDLNKTPVLDIRLAVRGKNQNLPTEGADSDEAAIMVPGKALNAGHDTVLNGCLCLCFFRCHVDFC